MLYRMYPVCCIKLWRIISHVSTLQVKSLNTYISPCLLDTLDEAFPAIAILLVLPVDVWMCVTLVVVDLVWTAIVVDVFTRS